MSFNKNSSKRLSIIAGIDRESNEINILIDDIAQKYLVSIINKLIIIVIFSGRKTINVEDLRFLSQIYPNFPQIACPANLTKLCKVCVDTRELEQVLKMQKGYVVYTRKKPFEDNVRKLLQQLYNEEIRIGKNVMIILQHLLEHYIINIMSSAAHYMKHDNRGTLLPRDIETCISTLKTP